MNTLRWSRNPKVTATTPESWQQMEALYQAALESSGDAREELLARADPVLRSKVEALLANANVDENTLDQPAWEWNDDPDLTAEAAANPSIAEMQPGELLGPYRIETKVGAGSMGDVYRATDTRLHRAVAVKVCRSQFSGRFEREARAIAALNHPNICQIYDVGPNYLVMEWVDGGPIVSATPIGEERAPMAEDDAIRLTIEIVSAIAAAHAKGIIHRDLKPANIMVSKQGTAKLLDFGIARQIQQQGEQVLESLTVGRLLIGTPAYMSPEQAECNDADERSDIFSLGAVLYEMLCGVRAFPGNTTASVLGAILHRPPDRLDAPPTLAGIVFKCLQKVPSDRYQSANELLTALRGAVREERSPEQSQDRTWTTLRKVGLLIACGLVIAAAVGLGLWMRGSSNQALNSIAVVPLAMESKDVDADYISDGIAGSINNSLAKLSAVKVIPSSVMVQYKGKAADFQQIGKALDVSTVLSGRVVQRGDDLSIDLELDDVHSGKQIWGQHYVRKVADLLLVQTDIAKEISQKLQSQLSAADRQRLTLGSTTNPEAYQLYLKGSYYTDKFTKDGFDKGIDYLNQAIALDPNYSQAYGVLAYNYINQDDWFIDPKVAGPKARDAAQKALSLDETDVTAHVALAIEEQWYEWNWVAAEREFKRAIELAPDAGEARGYYSWFLPPMLRNKEALEQAHLQLKYYPLSTGGNGNLGSVMVFAHQWDDAIKQLKYAIDLDPNYWFDYCFLGRAYEQKGQYAEAIDTFQRGLKLEGNIELWAGLGHAYAASGNRVEAQKVLDHLQEMSATTYIAPYNVALIYAGLGDNDKAFDWLNRAYSARSYLLVEYLNTDPRLDSLHADPRFKAFRIRVGLPIPKTD